jgi:hypothetical protein
MKAMLVGLRLRPDGVAPPAVSKAPGDPIRKRCRRSPSTVTQRRRHRGPAQVAEGLKAIMACLRGASMRGVNE